MLQRILRRDEEIGADARQAVSRAVGRLLEMLVHDLEMIMLGRNRLGVSNPGADDVKRVDLGVFGFTGALEVLPELRPDVQASLSMIRINCVRRFTAVLRHRVITNSWSCAAWSKTS